MSLSIFTCLLVYVQCIHIFVCKKDYSVKPTKLLSYNYLFLSISSKSMNDISKQYNKKNVPKQTQLYGEMQNEKYA